MSALTRNDIRASALSARKAQAVMRQPGRFELALIAADDALTDLEARFNQRTAEMIIHNGQALACSAEVARAYNVLKAELDQLKGQPA